MSTAAAITDAVKAIVGAMRPNSERMRRRARMLEMRADKLLDHASFGDRQHLAQAVKLAKRAERLRKRAASIRADADKLDEASK